MSLLALKHILYSIFPNLLSRDVKHSWLQQQYLILDMETTGLNCLQDKVISLGWVSMQDGAIKLNSARSILLDDVSIAGQSMEIHMLTDKDIADFGRNSAAVLRYLRQLLLNKILVVHHAPLDIGFLKKLWSSYQLKPLSIIVLDTLAIEKSCREKRLEILKTDAFRLSACRSRYGLPDYTSHDALTDALATAELLLAQIHHHHQNINLKELIHLGGSVVRLG
ncbi:3'-5' exonuclease [Agarilytica rhodophyticola]|uniref:3'-5' exonuclease n=1 Tax=Agarilytica rhodophyticola TaxID=1737490 RepID=UPI000B34707E|nr:3'-5' exonuclease [Agarilytica rhodophyticola]